MEQEFSNILINRFSEIIKCLNGEAYLAASIMMGSYLEGILFWTVTQFPEDANKSNSSPKNPKTNGPKPFREWTLSQLIEVAYENKWIGINSRKFSHSLREFRNLVHPYEQFKELIFPDKPSCQIGFQIIQLAFTDLEKHFKVNYVPF